MQYLSDEKRCNCVLYSYEQRQVFRLLFRTLHLPGILADALL